MIYMMKKHGLNEAQLRRRACQEKVLPKQIKVALKLISQGFISRK